MAAIKNIIFDLGGVFLQLNFQLTKELFLEYGIDGFDDFFTQHHADALFEDLEKGLITPEAFYNAFRQATNSQISNLEIQKAWNAMLISFPTERIEWLKTIKNKYNVYLFSNTNQIHYDAFMEIYERDLGVNDFNQHFIKAYYSQQMGLRKPYANSFMHIIDEQQLDIASTLFIDDTIKNIEAAKAIGLQTIHLVAPQTLLDLDL
ncbi:HAD family hydrolase [Parasediminibacterium sp. JCM 36343]|uniref:HAD family hydrolase n=1 Tax=Parasediminibacterium sp. JCM 36343 TaxID=3374279 RepID=UPI00397DB3AF